MKTLIAALLGVLACVNSASAYRLTPFQNSNTPVYYRDVWGMYHLVSLSVPAPILPQWVTPPPAANYFAAPTSPANLSSASPSQTPSSTINGVSVVASLVVSASSNLNGVGALNRPVIVNGAVADGGSTLTLLAGALGTIGWFQRRGRVRI